MRISLRQRFGQRFRELRLASGLSQEAFADHASMARSYLSRLERGMANPSLDAIEGLAKALGVDPRELFEIVEPATPQDVAEVPYASDGTCFHRELASPRDGTFRVGEKGGEIRLTSFEDAVEHLRQMPVAKWRRPNDAGNWGLVSAVRWGKPRAQKKR
ncbi:MULTISPECIES: helix-turn-helix domain-containing protein [unclassified Pseudomonas]|uniref:helix-turn-helix domain-containing protein n=1 Tax=unclassified Pseudomonas TaxID=196821 RepID=UPI00084BB674|nr:helix-turn-helix transcriptional regulator [Pseudomonas sp. AP42]OEC50640.1 transcriptional regulator [Pseudomonas sp. AP42]